MVRRPRQKAVNKQALRRIMGGIETHGRELDKRATALADLGRAIRSIDSASGNKILKASNLLEQAMRLCADAQADLSNKFLRR